MIVFLTSICRVTRDTVERPCGGAARKYCPIVGCVANRPASFLTLTGITGLGFSADLADLAPVILESVIRGNVAFPRTDRPLWIEECARWACESPLHYRLFAELPGVPVHGVAWRAPAQPPPRPTFPFLALPIKMRPLHAGALRSGASANGGFVVRDGCPLVRFPPDWGRSGWTPSTPPQAVCHREV